METVRLFRETEGASKVEIKFNETTYAIDVYTYEATPDLLVRAFAAFQEYYQATRRPKGAI